MVVYFGHVLLEYQYNTSPTIQSESNEVAPFFTTSGLFLSLLSLQLWPNLSLCSVLNDDKIYPALYNLDLEICHLTLWFKLLIFPIFIFSWSMESFHLFFTYGLTSSAL